MLRGTEEMVERIGGLDLWCSVSHQSDGIDHLIQPMRLALDATTR
jgi:hypothetical protein